jgi:molybdopterin-guanine dinucleotide biosynthesis protein A
MGRDKASLDPGDGGGPLARRSAEALLEAGLDPVLEIGPGVTELATVSDPRLGPLAALAAASPYLPPGRGALALACDLPGVDARLLSFLAHHPASGSVVPMADGHPQVLCARWSRPALDVAAALVASGERSVRVLLHADEVYLVSEQEWDPHAGPDALTDLDFPADLARWQARNHLATGDERR